MSVTPPRLSDGKQVLFAFYTDSEKGPCMITGPDLNLSLAIQLAQSAVMSFEAAWRMAIEKKQQDSEKKQQDSEKVATLIGLDGGKLA